LRRWSFADTSHARRQVVQWRVLAWQTGAGFVVGRIACLFARCRRHKLALTSRATMPSRAPPGTYRPAYFTRRVVSPDAADAVPVADGKAAPEQRKAVSRRPKAFTLPLLNASRPWLPTTGTFEGVQSALATSSTAPTPYNAMDFADDSVAAGLAGVSQEMLFELGKAQRASLVEGAVDQRPGPAQQEARAPVAEGEAFAHDALNGTASATRDAAAPNAAVVELTQSAPSGPRSNAGRRKSVVRLHPSPLRTYCRHPTNPGVPAYLCAHA
jgi:hypothetical protein